MKKIIRMTEADLTNLVQRVINEQTQTSVVQTNKNPFKDKSILNKYVGKQFQSYIARDGETIGKKGIPFRVFEIKGVDVTGKYNRLIFNLGERQQAEWMCQNGGDEISIYYHKNNTKKLEGSIFTAPSLTKELKRTFCTTGSGGQSVPKVDYPTP